MLQCRFVDDVGYIPYTGNGGGDTSRQLVETIFMTLLQTPWPLKNRWLHPNIYFRYLWAWPDVGMKVWTIADIVSDPI